MAESILVTGKKISAMELVTNVTGSEKIPTGQPDDLALTPNQIADHTIARGDLASQEDLSQVEVSLGTQITDLANEVNSADNSIRGLISAEEAARIAADNLKVDKQGSVSSVAGRVGDVVLAPSDVLVEGFGSQEDVNKYVPKPFLSGYTYGIGERVVLSNGEVVKSLVDGNVGNPNVDMTGWISSVSDSLSDTIQTFNTSESGVDPVTGVANGAYFNVRSESGETLLVEYQNIGGVPTPSGRSYPSSKKVADIEAGVSDLQERSDKQEDRNKDQINARDWGVLPTNLPELNSANWFALNNAFPERPALDIFVPEGTYNFSEGFYITRPHHIHGIGVGELSKTIFNFAGATPVGTVHYKASVFIIHPNTINDTSGNGATLPVGQVGTSGTGAVIDFIKVVGSSEHGIIKNAPSYLNGVAAMNNAKHGILTVANTGSGWPRISGIANQGANTECAALFNGQTGIVEIGDDANVIKNDTCLSAYNNHFGFYDASLLGGVCINNQAHVNILGDYVQQGSAHDNSGLPSTPSRVVYVGNYAEEQRPSAYSTNGRSIILSATGAQPESHNVNALLSSIVGLLTQNRFSVTQDAQAVYDGRGGNFASLSEQEIRFGTAAVTDNALRMFMHGKRFSIGDLDSAAITLFLEDFNRTLLTSRPWFSNGITMGTYHYQGVSTTKPTSGVWDIGNILWNELSVIGAPIGWVCTDSSGSGTWQEIGQSGIPKLQSSQILDKSHNINLQNKFFGKEVFNTTTNKFMRALGDQDTSDWLATDNTILTPQ